MSLLMSMFMGFVQGVAEFLPISSSGHLTLLQHFFGMKEVDNLFNILLHFATLLAVCVVYWKDIVEMVVEFFRGFASLFSGHGSRESRPHGPPPGVDGHRGHSASVCGPALGGGGGAAG